MNAPRITFLGGAGTVTGSKFLLETGRRRILVDCGLFQGYKQLRLRNWAPLPIDPARVDAVVLTHAHIDHSGYLPVFARGGFRGRVTATEATRDLCGILLPDSGYLQEQDAAYANRHGFSRHRPARPLYTEREGTAVIDRFEPLAHGETRRFGRAATVRLDPAGHILGSSIVTVRAQGRSVVFSGDLGRPRGPLMPTPTRIEDADYLVVESTYGGRLHERTDPEDLLAEVIVRTVGRGGTVLVPAFAVGRTQLLLYYLHRLKVAGRIPDVPVYLDSPMAIDASEIFCAHPDEHRLDARGARAACGVAHYVRDVEESKALGQTAMPTVILSASGMATGGRVLHHLKRLAPDPRNTVLFAGYQAAGTRGAALVGGARSVKIHGAYVDVRADVVCLHALSAHADEAEILEWLRGFRRPPHTTFIVHGEPGASDALRLRIEETLGWRCDVPALGERRTLD